MTDHSFRATLFVESAEDAEAKAHEACRRYFGDTPYTIAVDTEELRTASDRVLGYRCDVCAAADLT